MPEPHVYPADDRPDAEVWVADDGADGTWWPAELRMRTQQPDSTYRYNAAWHRDGQTYLDTFPQDHVRLEDVDMSAGRRPAGSP